MNGEDIIRFALANPWSPTYPEPVLRRFLTDYVSSPRLVFDVHDHRGRLAVAVLLDKVSNLANDACLEIIGARADAAPEKVFYHFVETAKMHMPPSKAGIQVGVSDQIVLRDEEVAAAGLVHYYDTFKMYRPSLQNLSESTAGEIQGARKEDALSVYDVLCRSFALNPETSIPSKEAWQKNFLSVPDGQVYLWRRDKEILGFASWLGDPRSKEMEVGTIGVLPKARKLGIGRQLLWHCLGEGAKLGYQSASLTVAVVNSGALGLYQHCGFNTVERFRCYRLAK